MSIIVLLLLLYNKSNSPKYFDERQLLLLLAILFISSSNLYYLNTYGFIKNQRYLYPDERRSLDSLTFKNNKQKCSSRNKKTYDDRIKEKANCNIENIEFNNFSRTKNKEKDKHILKNSLTSPESNITGKSEFDFNNNVKPINNKEESINNISKVKRGSVKKSDQYISEKIGDKNNITQKHTNSINVDNLDSSLKETYFGNINTENDKDLINNLESKKLNKNSIIDDIESKKVNKNSRIDHIEFKKINKDTIDIEDKNKTSSVPSINTSTGLKYDADSDTDNIHDQGVGNVTNDNISLIRNKSVISQIIKEKYYGMTVSIMLRGIGIITGKVVYYYEDITALQLKNNIIIYVNNNIIIDIF